MGNNTECTDTYNRKLNKTETPACPILGVNIEVIDMDWLLDYTDKHIKELSGGLPRYLHAKKAHSLTWFGAKLVSSVNGRIAILA